ncbi:MAG: hypothetical protein GX111_11015 [Clostridiales bacterium]|nr:hypothetical protein [Clostridiales bacterium]
MVMVIDVFSAPFSVDGIVRFVFLYLTVLNEGGFAEGIHDTLVERFSPVKNIKPDKSVFVNN